MTIGTTPTLGHTNAGTAAELCLPRMCILGWANTILNGAWVMCLPQKCHLCVTAPLHATGQQCRGLRGGKRL